MCGSMDEEERECFWRGCEERNLTVKGTELLTISPEMNGLEEKLRVPDGQWNRQDPCVAFALQLCRKERVRPLTEQGRTLVMDALRTDEEIGIRRMHHGAAAMLRDKDVSGMWEAGCILLCNLCTRQ